MIGELIPTGVTFGAGRQSINDMFSGTAEFNNIILDSGANFSGGTGGGIIYSGGTDLYDIFSGGSNTNFAITDLTLAGNRIHTIGTKEFQMNAGSSGTFIVSGSSTTGTQMMMYTESTLGSPSYVSAGKGIAAIISKSGSTVESSAHVANGTFKANYSASGLEREIEISGNRFQIKDTVDNVGVNYASNYHANYVDRTLVDKEYVVNSIASGATGGGVSGTGTTGSFAIWDGISAITSANIAQGAGGLELNDNSIVNGDLEVTGTTTLYGSETIRKKTTQDLGTTGGTIAWDINEGSNAKIVLNANMTLNISSMENGDYGTMKIVQDGTGSRTITLGTGTHQVVNSGGGSITLTTNPSSVDIISFFYDGSEFYWTVGNDYT